MFQNFILIVYFKCMKKYARYDQKMYSKYYFLIPFQLSLANNPNTQMLETEDEAWESFCALIDRPEPTPDELTTGILPYPLSQIHDHIGKQEQENIKSLPILVELKYFYFILLILIIALSEDMILFVFCCSLLLKYAHCKRLKRLKRCDIAITGLTMRFLNFPRK